MSEKKVIPFIFCAAQMFLAVTFGTTECFLLVTIVYDCYVSIYIPLLYVLSMPSKVYVPLIITCYAYGVLHALIHTGATFSVSSEINHIFRDIPPLLKIYCSDIQFNHLLLFFCALFIEIVTILIVLISYSFILFTILRTCSAEDKRKVFSMYGSHLTAVSIRLSTHVFMFMRPNSNYVFEHDMVV
ncbi:olfactory receptor 5T7-like [Peromyscus maniculatus bairdii]|uniref:olfactory receptor 5T7-like n=1 Tax=Peromyscus maniculatus bairdii TaxID=230844 RepID=UPI003FCF62DF